MPVVGRVFPTNKKSACSEGKLSRFRMTKMNCDTLRSPGTRNFCLSIRGTLSERLPRSTMTGIRPGNLSRMRRASSNRASNGFAVLKGISESTDIGVYSRTGVP